MATNVLFSNSFNLDIIKDIKDPERPESLEELEVVYESGVAVRKLNDCTKIVSVEFSPTVSHCNLATLIGNFSSGKFNKSIG